MTLFLLALAGGAGAGLRFVFDGSVRAWQERSGAPSFPLGILLVNVSGSFAMGLLAGVVLLCHAVPELQLILGTGLLGGYTTFSTASVDTVRLVREGSWGKGVFNALGTAVLTVAAACAGLAAAGLT
jgi:fluoride exporter